MVLAIDFGTTNTVIASWNTARNTPQPLVVPALSGPTGSIPSLVYVVHGLRPEAALVGQSVREGGYENRHDRRLFRNFKRGVVQFPPPPARLIDDAPWGDRQVADLFLNRVLERLPIRPADIDTLAITVPITAFEHYVDWLKGALSAAGIENILVVDESTAAALGYAVTYPGALVLVVDFGGGTLDLSLIQLPQRREKVGNLLHLLRRDNASENVARVVAKGGRVLGGADVDGWILAEVCRRAGIDPAMLGDDLIPFLTACEMAKIALSTEEQTVIRCEVGGQPHEFPFTRAELEAILEERGFYAALRSLADKIMHEAGREGIYREDVAHVVLVGGTALMPSVGRVLRRYFRGAEIRKDKPFTAVAEGALYIATGSGLQDYLVNSYGLRHLDGVTGRHAYEEIIPMGTVYPSEPVVITMGAAYNGQTEVEFVIGMLDPDAASRIELRYEGGQPVFVAHAEGEANRVLAMNEFAPPITVRLDPPGTPGTDRLRATFWVDAERRLLLSVTDLLDGRELVIDKPVVSVR
jgi:molecular chaperone DnaK (HSP70)